MKGCFIVILLFIQFSLFPQERVLIEGEFDDWDDRPVIYGDVIGDGGFGGIDFGDIKVYNDERFVFFSLEVGTEINLQSGNEITFYLDSDMDNSTGFNVDGIGAELLYSFGERSGTVYLNGASTSVNQHDIGLVSAPTVSGDRFEFALRLDQSHLGVDLFQDDQFRMMVKDLGLSGDELPDENGGVTYTLVTEALNALPVYSISRPNQTHFRLLSYNVLFNGLMDPDRIEYFERILLAIDPDIIAFQEIYGFSSFQVANQVATILPTEPDEEWFHASVEPDIHLISKFPITTFSLIEGVNNDQGNGAFLLELEDLDSELLIINAHTPCCENDAGRQWEIDAMMGFLRDLRNGLGPFELEEDSPVIICGDMNLVGNDDQLNTLITGDITNENIFGSDFHPDWNGNSLEDSRPYTTNLPMAFSWYDEESSFSPGRLDFQLYSGSVLEVQNSFSLQTTELPVDSLAQYEMLPQDTYLASDHLPLVVDFSLIQSTGLFDGIDKKSILCFPNPVEDVLKVIYNLKKLSGAGIFNSVGTLVSSIDANSLYSMNGTFQIDVSSFNQGIYVLRLHLEDGQLIQLKFVKI